MAASPPGWYGTPPQPSHGQTPPLTRRRGRAGWFAAGIAAVMLLVAVAAAALVMVVAREAPPAAWVPGGGEGQAPTPNATPTPDGPELSGEYGIRDDLCAVIDVAPLETLVPGAENVEDTGFSLLAWHWQCSYRLGEGDDRDPVPRGYLDLIFETHAGAEEAKQQYDEDPNLFIGQFDRHEEADGPWDEGLILYEDRSDNVLSFVNVGYKVLHGNLEVQADLQFSRPQDGVDRIPDMETALYQVVISAMEALALEPEGPEPSTTPS